MVYFFKPLYFLELSILRLFCPIWVVYFYRSKWYGGVPELKNIRYAPGPVASWISNQNGKVRRWCIDEFHHIQIISKESSVIYLMTKFDLTNESQMSQQTKVQAEGWKVKLIASQCYKHNVHQLKVYFFKSKFSIFCPMCGFVCILRHRVDIWCLLQWPEKLNMNQLNHLHLIFDYIFIKNYSILISCIMGQRESFFQSRDENESFSYSISHIETRPRISDT